MTVGRPNTLAGLIEKRAEIAGQLAHTRAVLRQLIDPAQQARWYGPETTVPDWRERLVCSRRGSRQVDLVVSGTKRR